MRKYVKKPIAVEAKQWSGNRDHALLDWLRDGGCEYFFDEGSTYELDPPLPPSLRIRTLEGVMEATPGDYIIKGVAGEFYPCRGDIFELTYTPVVEAMHG